MKDQDLFQEPQISNLKLHVRLQQITNPPKGETRTAMMPLEYNQPQIVYDFRKKYIKNNEEKLQIQDQKNSTKKGSILQVGQKNSSFEGSKIQQIGTPLAKKQEQDKSVDKQKNDTPASSSTLSPASPQVVVQDNHIDAVQQTPVKESFKHKEISLGRRRVKKLLKNRILVWFLRILTMLYLLIIFISIATQQLLDSDQAFAASFIIDIIELHFLAVFITEVILSAYAQGAQNYIRDKLQILDSSIILLALALVILDLGLGKSRTFTKIASVIKGMFRFFRIVLLFRKASKFKKINVSSTIKTPAERIIDVFNELKEFFDSPDIIEKLEWSVNMIASNKLYETNILKGNEKNKDIAQWINYGARLDDEKKDNTNEIQMVQVKPTDTKLQPYLNRVPQSIIDKFKDINEIHFDCFEMEKISEGQETSYLLLYLFCSNNILGSVDIDPLILTNFFKQVEKGYHNNLYHNRLHAFDVIQTANFFLKACNLMDISGINEFELGVIYISAACHDYDHPGYNNAYIISSSHEIALTYNDQSVLENHHASQTFLLFSDQSLDITINFTKEQYRQFRSMLISIILSTDMSKHFSDIAKLKSRLGSADFEIKGKDKQMCIDTMIHACDVSNPVKQWNIYQQWAQRVLSEFWQQGDLEKSLGLPVTYLCDRVTTNTAKSQVGFIDFVVRPLYEVISNFIPEIKNYIQQIDSNKTKWSELITFYDQELEKQKEQKQLKQ